MSTKVKGKKRKDEIDEILDGDQAPPKPRKEEFAIAKWMKKNVPVKKTKFVNFNVEYFTGSKAVTALLDTHWAKGDSKTPPLFTTRQEISDFLNEMMRHNFFHRAKKVPLSEQELKMRTKKKLDDKKKSPEPEPKPDEKDNKGTDAEQSQVEGQKSEGEKQKQRRKIRLEMHMDQSFADNADAYVWIYDPVPVYYWFFGTLVVLAAIGICLFPLWPPEVRKGVYYLSIAAAGFLVFIISLVVIRLIIFALVWLLTFGRHHIWLLPNLTEDVGFFASFWPLYHYEYMPAHVEKGKKKGKKKAKDSDAEEEKSVKKNVEAKESNEKDKEPLLKSDGPYEPRNSESESESSQKSSTGKDFEIVSQDDVEALDETAQS